MQHHLEEASTQNLAELFDRKINLSEHVNGGTSDLQSDKVDLEGQPHPVAPQINYSISQHYTHSAHVIHVVSAHQTSQTPANGNLQPGLSMYQTLAQHNIPPASLLPSQLNLFEQADKDQRSRLIQLWTISPPTRKELADGIGEYQSTTLEQEEERAWMRHQHKSSIDEPQATGEQVDANFFSRSLSSREGLPTAEMYMTSGYEQIARHEHRYPETPGLANVSPSAGLLFGTQYKHATDPVHLSTGWQRAEFELDPMEHQYVMLDQIEQFPGQAQNIVHIHEPEDEEMF